MSVQANADLFGTTSMGYLVIESQRLDEWQSFLEDGIGMHVASRRSDTLTMRMDEHRCRVLVKAGPAEDVVAIGYQVRDDETLARIIERLARHGIAFETGSHDEARARGVSSFTRFVGPKRMDIELFTDPLKAAEPLAMRASGFVTGDAGMGHVAITSRRPEDMIRFWTTIFDARLSDRVEQAISGVMMDIEFFRVNRRHHTIAIAASRGPRLDPIRTRVQHFNVEVATLDDMTDAFVRCKKLGFEMAHEIGQHPNDKELSFYAISPSGFEVECGWRALSVDEATWRSGVVHDRISSWGHKPERASTVHSFALNAGNLARGARSVLNPEYSPLDGGKP